MTISLSLGLAMADAGAGSGGSATNLMPTQGHGADNVDLTALLDGTFRTFGPSSTAGTVEKIFADAGGTSDLMFSTRYEDTPVLVPSDTGTVVWYLQKGAGGDARVNIFVTESDHLTALRSYPNIRIDDNTGTIVNNGGLVSGTTLDVIDATTHWVCWAIISFADGANPYGGHRIGWDSLTDDSCVVGGIMLLDGDQSASIPDYVAP